MRKKQLHIVPDPVCCNRRTSVERFIDSCPKSPQMTDDEIQAEVNAVRYGTTSSAATVTSPTSKNMQAFQS